MEILDQIAELDRQKQNLLDQAHREVLARANDAVEQLNRLGFQYRLTGGPTPPPTKRTTGIRTTVLELITNNPGITRQQLLQTLNATTDKDIQSISNALAALKRSSSIIGENGTYHVETTT